MEIRKGGQPSKYRTITENVWALPGAGKTTHLLTFPPPLFLLNCDRSMDSLLQKLPASHEIYYEEMLLKPGEQLSQATAIQFLNRFEALVALALKKGEGTFGIDGGARFWDVIKMAKLPAGAADSSDRRPWEIPNEYWRSYLLGLEASPLQFCITHPAVTIWESMTKESERLRPDAFKHLPYFSTIDIYLFTINRETDLYPRLVENQALQKAAMPSETEHWAKIYRNKENTRLEGRVVPNLTFPLLYQMTFGEEWKGVQCWKP